MQLYGSKNSLIGVRNCNIANNVAKIGHGGGVYCDVSALIPGLLAGTSLCDVVLCPFGRTL